MRYSFSILVLALLSAFPVKAADDFSVSRIPAHLFKNANAVVRVDELEFEIINKGRTVQRSRYVITILNEKADGFASFSEYYTKHRKINHLEGFLYDAAGKQLSKLKMKDAQDLSLTDEGTLADDNRMKQFGFSYRVYPYTVEFISEVEQTSTLFFPTWVGQPGELVSVQSSWVSVTSPLDYQYRFKSFNYKGEPATQRDSKTKTDTWKVTDLAAFKREPYSPLMHEYVPTVILGPTDFKVEDYEGNMSSWIEFGKFVNTLRSGRDELPENVKGTVRELTRDLPDAISKIKVLYQYLQKNTRYISIQLGIGGWQPFDAKFVASKAYGDCKALANYMYSLLKEVSIPSYYALVKAGARQNFLNVDFPSQQFNHVILCVPLAKDTVWLECTSQSLPAGYLGDFTNDRPALLISEKGGEMVMTKRYPFTENLQARRIDAVLDESSGLNLKVATNYSGLQMDNVHGLINSLSKEKIREYLQEGLDFPTYDISSFSYKERKSFDPAISEELEIKVSSYATQTGKRIFIVPNVMNRWSRRLTSSEERKFDVVLTQGFQDVDSITIEIPQGYSAESIPAELNLKTPFGVYASKTLVEGNKIIYYRRFIHHEGRFPAASYNELVKFYEQVYKADRSKLVLVRNS
jgi:hypothetical protein